MLTIRPIDAPVRENGYKGEQGTTTRDAGDDIISSVQSMRVREEKREKEIEIDIGT